MRLLIDSNIFHKFFDTSHKEHPSYERVYRCLFECKGKMYSGGSTFEKEIRDHLKKYRRILVELSRRGKLEILPTIEVDKETKRIKQLDNDTDFDDPHIIACVILGKIQVVCTDDSRADRFIKDSKFYPKHFRIPSIYRTSAHKHLVQSCFPRQMA